MARKPKEKVKKPEPIPIYATPEMIRDTQSEIRELESMLEEDKRRKVPKITDPDGVRAEILKKQQYILRNSPSILKGEAANKAYKKAKELETVIKGSMIKQSLFSQRYPKGSDSYRKQKTFEDAVQQQMKFQTDPTLKRAVWEYKAIMAQLSGNDPNERNIERLRSQR